MIDQEHLINIVFSAIDEINETLPADKRFSKTMQTVLFDPGGHIDSLGLTMFIVALEQKIEQEFQSPVILAGEYSMSDENSPFRSVQSLVNHIERQLENKINA